VRTMFAGTKFNRPDDSCLQIAAVFQYCSFLD
jgi:hypothetical protein